jgi:dTDP-4-amino-4,6-dideoxygalactose transaminase
MIMSNNPQTCVPFVDLRAHYSAIQHEVRPVIDEVLSSAQFVGGRYVERFEQEFAAYVGAKNAIGVGSGTSALELSLKAIGVGVGDEVVVPANTFIATAEAVSNVGAIPVFADIEPQTFHINALSVEQVLTDRTRCVIPVHLYGRAVDMTKLEELAKTHHFEIIEDAAQAHGAQRNGVRVGGSGRVTCFSFYPGKNLGAYGDGGMITTDDPNIAAKLRLLRDHGSPAKYEHSIVGTNSRLDAIQAAVLSVKLRHLDEWNDMRREHAGRYMQLLEGADLTLPRMGQDREHVFHLFVLRVRERNDMRAWLRGQGIDAGVHYPVPLHLTPAYQALGYPGHGTFPISEAAAQEILSLPMFPELTSEQLSRTAEAVIARSSRTKTKPSLTMA